VEIVSIPVVGRVQGCIRPPGSKSISNRALVCAALAQGGSRLSGLLVSEDTEVMIDSWRRLGVQIAPSGADFAKNVAVSGEAAALGAPAGEVAHWTDVQVIGCNGRLPQQKADLWVANSGTTIRFMTAALSACHGEFVLDGVARMRQRPIGDLITALQHAGVRCESTNIEHPDCPPVRLLAAGLPGGRLEVEGNVSSQFLSGLLLAAPYAQKRVDISVVGELVSRPYVAMTIEVMKQFGAQVEQDGPDCWRIEPGSYQGRQYEIEPDASAASYFWAAAAITGGDVVVAGLSAEALQGDVHFCKALQQMGCNVQWQADSIRVQGGKLRGVDIEMSNISDTVQTLAVVALFAEGPTRVRGVAHNRFKETDRIGDLATELRKLGAQVDEHADGLTIHPGACHGARLATYHDHRMAMSLALAGLRIEGIDIENPACTSKTYPNYFEDLGKLIGQRIERYHL
jgi:3-phosphoshikimate 1-carboxyvinyltransferase